MHRLAREAVTDLDDIWSYIARESGRIEIADRLIESLARRFVLLAEQPWLGRPREELRAGLRSFPAERYVIVYRIENGSVVILRILHGARDIQAIFQERM